MILDQRHQLSLSGTVPYGYPAAKPPPVFRGSRPHEGEENALSLKNARMVF
jgi:hypothetical protein